MRLLSSTRGGESLQASWPRACSPGYQNLDEGRQVGPSHPPNPGGTPSFSSKPQTSSRPGATSSRGLSLRLPPPPPGIQVGHSAPLQLRELELHLHSHGVPDGMSRGLGEECVRGQPRAERSRSQSQCPLRERLTSSHLLPPSPRWPLHFSLSLWARPRGQQPSHLKGDEGGWGEWFGDPGPAQTPQLI